MFKKILSLFLALLMLMTVVSLWSCSEEKDDPKDTSNDADVSGSDDTTEYNPDTYLDILEQRKSVKETLPEGLDFNEQELYIALQEEYYDDVWAENGLGSNIDDLIFERNSYVSELLNITIVEPAGHPSYWMQIQEIQRLIDAGSCPYDLFLGHAVGTGSAIVKGQHYINWLSDEVQDLGYINFENPWYPQDVVENLTIEGQMYLAVSDMALSVTKNTMCIYYNKDLAENYNFPNLYDLVWNGEWTLDKIHELTKDIYEDQNLNNTRDYEDLYGFTTEANALQGMMWSCDQTIWDYDPETFEYINTFDSQSTSDLYDKLYTILFDTPGTLYYTHPQHGDPETSSRKLFADGNAVIATGTIGQALSEFNELDNYGILPYPKFNKEQENFGSLVGGSFSVMAIPVTCEKLDVVCAAVEALSAYSWKNIMPVYYDLVLKLRGTRDNESIMMLDYIMDTRAIDFQYVYDQGYVFDIFFALESGLGFSSYCASVENQRQRAYEQLLNYFKNN